MSILKLSGISLSFKDGEQILNVLKNINLTFSKPEVVALVGESGSGKTSILNIIAGLIKPNHGSLFFHDTNILNLSDYRQRKYRKKKISYIFQQYNLISNLKVTDNLEVVCSETSRIKAFLQKIKLEKAINQRSGTLSGGEQQRIALVRTRLRTSEILLADEPTGSLDSKNAKIVMNELVNSEAKLVIFVTHDISLANEYADRIISLKNGNIVSDNTFRSSSRTSIAQQYNSTPIIQCFKLLISEVLRKPNRIFVSFISTVISSLFTLLLFSANVSANLLVESNYVKTYDSSILDITSYSIEGSKIKKQEVPYQITQNIGKTNLVRENINPILEKLFDGKLYYQDKLLPTFNLKAGSSIIYKQNLLVGVNPSTYTDIIVNEAFCSQVLFTSPNDAINKYLEVNYTYTIGGNISYDLFEKFKIVGVSFDSFLIKSPTCYFEYNKILQYIESKKVHSVKLYDCFLHMELQIEIKEKNSIINEINNVRKNPFYQSIENIQSNTNFSIVENENFQDYMTYSSLLSTSSVLLFVFLGFSIIITIILNINIALSFINEISKEIIILKLLGVSNSSFYAIVCLYITISTIPGILLVFTSFNFILSKINNEIYNLTNLQNLLINSPFISNIFLLISGIIFLITSLLSILIIYMQNEKKMQKLC